MKAKQKTILFLLLLFAVIVSTFVACSNEDINMYYHPPRQTPFSTDLATQYLAELEALWDTDSGELWGIPLSIPYIIVDNITRKAVANMPDYDGIFTYENGAYVGFLPNDIVIGTTQELGGRIWYILSWDLLKYNADNMTQRLRHMSREGFHTIQLELFSGFSGWSHHTGTKENRLSTFLEMHALLTALNSDGEERLDAIYDALSIRAARHQSLTRYQVGIETSHEIFEGTAQYTEYMLIFEMGKILPDIRWHLEYYVGGPYAWLTFAYFGGAMYALLLSEMNVDWKNGLSFGTDLGRLLKDAVGITELRPLDEVNLLIYEYERIVAAEEVWFEQHDKIAANAETIFAAGRTLLEIPFSADMSFSTLEHIFTSRGLVFYGTFEATGVFGRLSITDGHLLHGHGIRYKICAAEIEIDSNRITGSYWELILNYGFEVIQDTNIFGDILNRFSVRRIA